MRTITPGHYARIVEHYEGHDSEVRHFVSEDGEEWVGVDSAPPYPSELQVAKLGGVVEPWSVPRWLLGDWGAEFIELDQ